MDSESSDNKVTTREEYELWTLMTQVNDGMMKAREKELRPYGISTVQVGVMYAVKGIGRYATPSAIARWLSREPHTISAALDRMEKAGLVRRTRNDGGKKQVLVEITEKGEDIFRRQNRQRKVIHSILGCMSTAERTQLRQLLERMRRQTLQALIDLPPFP